MRVLPFLIWCPWHGHRIKCFGGYDPSVLERARLQAAGPPLEVTVDHRVVEFMLLPVP